MIKLSMKLPKYLAVAVSGGADSMAVLDFLNQHREVVALHFNHGTSHSKDAESIVTDYCDRNDISLVVGNIKEDIPKGVSKEEFWRKSRYKFFENEAGKLPVVTCHHLDDVVETWLFTSFHGDPQLIPSRRGRYLRPFLETRKAIFEDWCERKDVGYTIDPSNKDTSFMRNYIRHEVVPKVLRVNPGLHKVLRKKIRANPVIFDEAF